MTTPSDLTLASHEAAHAQEPWVLVRESYYQPNFASTSSVRGWTLYTVLTGEYKGSDKRLDSLFKLGLRVEVVA